jgi:hypothetical protein
MITRFPMVETTCAWCDDYPCRCPAPVRCTCVCGALLEARDDLEEKRQVAAKHVQSVEHRRWRRHG